MIGLSLLPSSHPSTFQRKLVRASKACYCPFTLDKGRSPGFASAQYDSWRPIKTRSRSGYGAQPLNLAALTQLVGSLSKRHAVTTLTGGSDRLWTDGFRFCFTPLSGVLPTFPSRYWFAIGLPVVFSLAGWSPRIRTGFLVPRPTQVPHLDHLPCVYGSVTLCAAPFQTLPLQSVIFMERPYYPATP